MFSDRTHGTVARLSLCALLLATLACGRKGDPQPPPRKNPARTRDLTVSQRGNDLILTMSYPATTSGGLALAAIDKMELWQYTRPATELMEFPEEELEAVDGAEVATDSGEATTDAEEPTVEPVAEAPQESVARRGDSSENEADESIDGTEEVEILEVAPVDPYLSIKVDLKDFDKRAQSILELEGDDLEAAVTGGRIIMRVALEEISTEPPTVHAFAVQSSVGRLRSERSSPTAFAPRPPPAPLTDVEITASARGVSLKWSIPDDEAEIEGYHVYRRLAVSPEFDQPLIMVLPGIGEHDDWSARYGARYVYSVTAVRAQRPLVESALSAEQSIHHVDVFPPPAPTGLVSLAEVGRVRLLWDAGRGRDTVGYLVFAQRGDDGPEPLTAEPITASEFIHEGASSGVTYVYTVLAVDSAGNQSKPSEAATTRVP
jgi:hypothetical protein